jgi:hypothetical protein
MQTIVRENTMKYDQEKYVWIYDESTMGIQDFSETSLCKIGVCHDMNSTSDKIW